MKRSLKSLLLICSWKPLCLGCFSCFWPIWTKVPAFEVLLKIHWRLDSPLVNPLNQTFEDIWFSLIEEAETSAWAHFWNPFEQEFWWNHKKLSEWFYISKMNSFHRMGLLFEQNVTLLVWKSPRAQCEFYWAFWKSHYSVPLFYHCDDCLFKILLKFFCKGQGLMYAAGSLQRT